MKPLHLPWDLLISCVDQVLQTVTNNFNLNLVPLVYYDEKH